MQHGDNLRAMDKLKDQFIEEIYKPFYRLVLYYFTHKGSGDPCDLAQETFSRAFQGYASFNGVHPKAWIKTIAKRVHLNELRKKRPKTDVINEEEERSDHPSPDESLINAETLSLVKDAVNQLPAQMQYIVKLRYFQGLTYEEISTVTRININTVKSHLAQAKQKLKKSLADYVIFER